MSHWQTMIVEVGDRLLGWTLSLPRDLAQFVIAGITVATLLVIRYLVADRTALSQLSEDERRLEVLRCEARARGDAEALDRTRTIRRLLAGRRLQLEWLPAVVGLVPTLLIVSWGAHRLEHLPLPPDEPFEFRVTLPASAIGGHAHVVPLPDWSVENGWVQSVEPSDARGVAIWKLRPPTTGETVIVVRHSQGNVEHSVNVGVPTYQLSTLEHGQNVSTQILMKPYRPFGVVPAIAPLGMPAWTVGLLLFAVPMYLTSKRLLGLP